MKRLVFTTSLILTTLVPCFSNTNAQPDLRDEEQSITMTDGVFREYRVAVLFTKEEFESEQFNSDYTKVKEWLKHLETYLNNIFVRDAGIKFNIMYDERLICTDLSSSKVYLEIATDLINERIGSDSYDVGMVCAFYGDPNNPGLAGIASVGGVKFDSYKANIMSMKQGEYTLAHEAAHYFGCFHTYQEGSEPGSGQSVCSKGSSSNTDFLNLASIVAIQPCAKISDRRVDATQRHTATNTAPRIDRTRMKREYIVPRNTFFTIPVYATDNEQDSLYYTYNQWGYKSYAPARFATLPPSRDNVLSFGRKYCTSNLYLLPNSDTMPVGEYKMLISVSDALPTDEAIAKKQAPLYDNFLTVIKVVDVEKPFKITSTIGTKLNPEATGDNRRTCKTGERFTLTWDVDKTFFDADSKVRILLSDDGGNTFKHTLVPSTANDGECEVVMPQFAVDQKVTYAYQDIPIFYQGQAVVRLEVIGKGYYDITDNCPTNGGTIIQPNDITFTNLPDSNYIKLNLGDTIPPIANVKAEQNGQQLNVTYSESQEDNLLRRLWVAGSGAGQAAYVQYIDLTDIIDSVKSVEQQPLNDPSFYDLQGRKVFQPQKGQLYIYQGKKIIY